VSLILLGQGINDRDLKEIWVSTFQMQGQSSPIKCEHVFILQLLLTVVLIPQSIFNHTISDIVISNTESTMKDLAAVSSRGHLGKWFEGSAYAKLNYVSAKG
jgi:hypothetical protein